jgi:hypothetical protein
MQGNPLAQVPDPSLGLASRSGRRFRSVAGEACRDSAGRRRVGGMRLVGVEVGENQRAVAVVAVHRSAVVVAAGIAHSDLGDRRVVGPLRRVTGYIAAWEL